MATLSTPDSALQGGVTLAAAAAGSTAPGRSAAHSYGQILRSSVLIGGSSLLEIAIGIVRTKANALLLGPAGFGLMGLYLSILNLAQSVAGMGVNSSGVRQIAAAVGSGDSGRIARTTVVLRRASVGLGLLGGVLLIVLARPISRLSFGSYEFAGPVALLSLAVLFRVVSDGQRALIQGLRRLDDLATITVVGGAIGTVASVALVWALRERGVVLTLVAINAATLLLSWRLSRQVKVERPQLTTAQVGQEVGALLQLGFAFLASGMLTMGAAYAIRIVIVREVSLTAAGLYQSAWTLAGLYVGFVLRAMGADFYPRLTAAIRDRGECNRLVNEQAEVSLLLAGPGIIATLAFAPLVVTLFYSSAFQQAVEVLRWIVLGATLQVITWPIGYIVVAEGRQGIFFLIELAYTVAYLALGFGLVRALGIDGAGVAFFISYLFHCLLVYPVVRRLTGFRWSAVNLRLGIASLGAIGLVFCSYYVLPFWASTTLGCLAVLLSSLHSARALARLVSADRVPDRVRRWLAWLPFAPRRANGGGQ